MTDKKIHENKQHEIIEATKVLIKSIGEDLQREGLKRTPERVARASEEIFSGYTTDPEALINNALFNVDYDQMVVVKDINFYSMCEHHILPFFWQSPCCLSAKRKSHRTFKDTPPNCRYVCA